MTQQEAYIHGFCKTAEENGVAPEELMKVAGLGSFFAPVGSFLSSTGKYLHRLAGGNVGNLERTFENAVKHRRSLLQGLDSVRAAGHPELMQQFRRPIDSMSSVMKRTAKNLKAEREAVRKARLGTGAVLTGGTFLAGLPLNAVPDKAESGWIDYRRANR